MPRAAVFLSRAEEHVLAVPVVRLLAAWPPEIQRAIARCVSAIHEVHFPLAVLDPMLRRGEKLLFRWSCVRNWIRPALSVVPELPEDDPRLEIPLPLLAKFYLGQAGHSHSSAPCPPPVERPGASWRLGSPAATSAQTLKPRAGSDAEAKPSRPSRPRLTPMDWLRKLQRLPTKEAALVIDPIRGLIAGELPPSWDGESLASQVSHVFLEAHRMQRTLGRRAAGVLWVSFTELTLGVWEADGYHLAVVLREARGFAARAARQIVEEWADQLTPFTA